MPLGVDGEGNLICQLSVVSCPWSVVDRNAMILALLQLTTDHGQLTALAESPMSSQPTWAFSLLGLVFIAAVFVGLVDTLGRAFLPDLLRAVLSTAAAATAAPALSSMLIYLVMAAVLVLRPEGLFPAPGR